MAHGTASAQLPDYCPSGVVAPSLDRSRRSLDISILLLYFANGLGLGLAWAVDVVGVAVCCRYWLLLVGS